MRTRMSGGVAGDVGLNARRPYADSRRFRIFGWFCADARQRLCPSVTKSS